MEYTLTRAELEEARGGLASPPEPNGDDYVRRCFRCHGALPVDAGLARRYCSSRCQKAAKEARRVERSGATASVKAVRAAVQPGLVELVTALVAAGVVVNLERDGWRLVASN